MNKDAQLLPDHVESREFLELGLHFHFSGHKCVICVKTQVHEVFRSVLALLTNQIDATKEVEVLST